MSVRMNAVISETTKARKPQTMQNGGAHKLDARKINLSEVYWSRDNLNNFSFLSPPLSHQ